MRAQSLQQAQAKMEEHAQARGGGEGGESGGGSGKGHRRV